MSKGRPAQIIHLFSLTERSDIIMLMAKEETKVQVGGVTHKKRSRRVWLAMTTSAVLVVKRVVRALYRRKYVTLCVALVILLIAAASWNIHRQHEHDRKVKEMAIASNSSLNQAVKQPVPSDATEKVIHYSRIGQNFADSKDYKDALDAYLTADSYIKDRSAKATYSENMAIYSVYLQLGNKSGAHKYLQREIDRLKSDPNAAEGVKDLQKLEQQL
jgi:tetratricopeptide (TPR) repeat protein